MRVTRRWSGQLGITEYSPPSGLDIGGGDEDLDRRFAQTTEVDASSQDVTQGIQRGHTEVVRREQARGQIHCDEHRRIVECPVAEHYVERPAP